MSSATSSLKGWSFSKSSSGSTPSFVPAANPAQGRFKQRGNGHADAVAVATRGTASNYLQRAPSPSGLADVIDLILDKGLVIDAYVRIAVIGIELVTIDARIVIASVHTYLRSAEAVNRLDARQTA